MSESAIGVHRDERLAIIVTIVVLGLALSILVPLPVRSFVLQLFGSELTLSFSGPVQMIILMAALVCAGVDTLVRSRTRVNPHPVPSLAELWLERLGALAYSMTFWALPTLLTVIGLVVLQTLGWWGYQLIFAALVGGLLATVVSFQMDTMTLDTAPSRRLRLVLNGIVYGTAYALFALIFGVRLRSLLSATSILLASWILALELFRNADATVWQVWLYAGLTGLIMGELTWALNYTRFGTRLGGALLLLIFYTLTGLAQQYLWQRINRRVVTEYLVVLLAGMVVLSLIF